MQFVSLPFVQRLARWIVAAVWIFHGLFSKLLGYLPRHEAIVGRILGDSWAAPLTLAIGLGEVLLGLWMLSGRRARLCAATQTALIVVMNSLEIALARDLLWNPAAMVALNIVLLSLAWFSALSPRRDQ